MKGTVTCFLTFLALYFPNASLCQESSFSLKKDPKAASPYRVLELMPFYAQKKSKKAAKKPESSPFQREEPLLASIRTTSQKKVGLPQQFSKLSMDPVAKPFQFSTPAQAIEREPKNELVSISRGDLLFNHFTAFEKEDFLLEPNFALRDLSKLPLIRPISSSKASRPFLKGYLFELKGTKHFFNRGNFFSGSDTIKSWYFLPEPEPVDIAPATLKESAVQIKSSFSQRKGFRGFKEKFDTKFYQLTWHDTKVGSSKSSLSMLPLPQQKTLFFSEKKSFFYKNFTPLNESFSDQTISFKHKVPSAKPWETAEGVSDFEKKKEAFNQKFISPLKKDQEAHINTYSFSLKTLPVLKNFSTKKIVFQGIKKRKDYKSFSPDFLAFTYDGATMDLREIPIREKAFENFSLSMLVQQKELLNLISGRAPIERAHLRSSQIAFAAKEKKISFSSKQHIFEKRSFFLQPEPIAQNIPQIGLSTALPSTQSGKSQLKKSPFKFRKDRIKSITVARGLKKEDLHREALAEYTLPTKLKSSFSLRAERSLKDFSFQKEAIIAGLPSLKLEASIVITPMGQKETELNLAFLKVDLTDKITPFAPLNKKSMPSTLLSSLEIPEKKLPPIRKKISPKGKAFQLSSEPFTYRGLFALNDSSQHFEGTNSQMHSSFAFHEELSLSMHSPHKQTFSMQPSYSPLAFNLRLKLHKKTPRKYERKSFKLRSQRHEVRMVALNHDRPELKEISLDERLPRLAFAERPSQTPLIAKENPDLAIEKGAFKTSGLAIRSKFIVRAAYKEPSISSFMEGYLPSKERVFYQTAYMLENITGAESLKPLLASSFLFSHQEAEMDFLEPFPFLPFKKDDIEFFPSELEMTISLNSSMENKRPLWVKKVYDFDKEIQMKENYLSIKIPELDYLGDLFFPDFFQSLEKQLSEVGPELALHEFEGVRAPVNMRKINEQTRFTQENLSWIPENYEMSIEEMSSYFNSEIEVAAHPNGNGYLFSLSLQPKANYPLSPIKQNFYFVIDASSSIERHRFECFKQSIFKSLDQLDETHAFNIVFFDKHVEQLNAQPLQATPENILAAKAFVQGKKHQSLLSSRDSLKVIADIKEQLSQSPEEQNTIILLTNGKSLETLMRKKELMAELVQSNEQSCFSLYTAAASSGNNLGMLELVSRQLHGKLLYSPTNAAFPRKVAGLVRKLSQPLIDHLSLTPLSSDKSLIVTLLNAKGSTLYSNDYIQFYGSIDKLQPFDIIIQGKYKGNWVHFKKRIAFDAPVKGGKTLQKEFAMLLAQKHFRSYILNSDQNALINGEQALAFFDIPSPLKKP